MYESRLRKRKVKEPEEVEEEEEEVVKITTTKKKRRTTKKKKNKSKEEGKVVLDGGNANEPDLDLTKTCPNEVRGYLCVGSKYNIT
jgi:hypothetical protein